MGGRYDLTDFEWSAIETLLPNKPRGVPRVDDRRALNGRRRGAACRIAMRRIEKRLNRVLGAAPIENLCRAGKDCPPSNRVLRRREAPYGV